jgi:CubicO group peptidase (beta-lactamase class C family)
MTTLSDVLQAHVGNGSAPGAVGLVARGERVEVQAVGSVDVEGTAPMTRDSIFRIASITKPITAAAVMMLVDEGRIALQDSVEHWLPELASPTVVRTPASAVDDVVPAARPITVFDLLTFRAGYGFPSDFSLPAIGALFSELKQGPPQPQLVAPPDEWMATLSRIPLLHQPGEAWLYNTCSDILGVLVARVSGRPFAEFLTERLFDPLGMVDTGFEVPQSKLGRFTSYYRTDPAGGLELVDGPDGQWRSMPAFSSGGGGLVSTVDDWYAFGRMLLADGDLRRPPAVVCRVGAADDHRPRDPVPARRQRIVPRGPGLGFRRIGRCRGHRSLERAGPLRLGRRHWDGSPHRPVQRVGDHPAQSAGAGRTDPARSDAGPLAVRGQRLTSPRR